MTYAPWVAAVFSTVGWVAFDVLRKALVRQIEVAQLTLWLHLAQIPGYLLWATLENRWEIGPGYWSAALCSIALNLVATLAFLEAMRRVALSVAIPLLSFTPVFVALASIPFLGEHLVWSQWCGIALVTGGALYLPPPSDGQSSLCATLRGFFSQSGVFLMLLVAVLWAFTPLADKTALQSAGIGVHGLVLACGVSLGMTGVLLYRGQLRHLAVPRSAWTLVGWGGLINVLSLGLQLVAISSLLVSVFEAFKRSCELLLSLLTGALFFREPFTRRKLIAAVVMAAGVILVLFH